MKVRNFLMVVAVAGAGVLKAPTLPAETTIALEAAPRLQEQPQKSEDRREQGGDRSGGDKVERRRAMLIEPSELQERRRERGLRILDTRSKEEYQRAHIPNAVRVDVKSWQEVGKRRGGFRDTRAWAEKVGGVGVSAESRVVVYGSNLSSTARIWWLLKYVGVENAMILNGGWEVWTKEGRPTETAVPAIRATRFVPHFDSDRLVEMDPLRDLLRAGKVKVVDTRSKGEFTGAVVRGKRGGHIPGATHLEWKELVAEDGRVKTVAQLQELFRQRGILPSETAVCY